MFISHSCQGIFKDYNVGLAYCSCHQRWVWWGVFHFLLCVCTCITFSSSSMFSVDPQSHGDLDNCPCVGLSLWCEYMVLYHMELSLFLWFLRWHSHYWSVLMTTGPLWILEIQWILMDGEAACHWIYANKTTPGALLLKWIDFNPSMDKLLHHYKVWDGIIYPFPNFNSAAVEVWEWIHPTLYLVCIYWSILWFKFIHISKRV